MNHTASLRGGRERVQGLTMIEVMIAIAVLAIVLAAVAWASMSSIRQNSLAGVKTQAVQVLNYFGRRLAGGDSMDLSAMVWNYGELGAAFDDLESDSRDFDPDRFRVTISSPATMGIASAQISLYRIEVCWSAAANETCVSGDTGGPPISDSGGALLPGIN